MGAAHTVQAPGSWGIPTRTQLSRGHAIREQVANTHYDTPGAWARMINNLYEYCKPPLITGVPIDPVAAAGADTWTTLARYKVPVSQVGTGDGSEGLIFSAYATVAGGDTGYLRVTTPAAPSPAGISFSGAAAWRESLTSKTDLTDSLGGPSADPEIVLEGKATTNGANLTVDAWHVDWWAGDTTLPDGPYDNVFSAMEPAALTAQELPVSVFEMQRMHRNLIDLYRRRTAGVICMQFWANSKMPTGKVIRQLTTQPPFVTHVRVWVYGNVASAWWRPRLGARHPAQQPLTATTQWHSLDFDIPRVTRPTEIEFSITATGVVQGVCAWFLPVTGPLR